MQKVKEEKKASEEVIDLTGDDEDAQPLIKLANEDDNEAKTAIESIRENQHVFVRIGKTEHEAIIVSISYPKAMVKWLLTNAVQEVDISSIEPMPWTNDNAIGTNKARLSKRKRRQTNKYMP